MDLGGGQLCLPSPGLVHVPLVTELGGWQFENGLVAILEAMGCHVLPPKGPPGRFVDNRLDLSEDCQGRTHLGRFRRAVPRTHPGQSPQQKPEEATVKTREI